MLTIHTIAELHAQIQDAKQQGQRVGFVPTMGNLHAGHISLVNAARETCDFVVASIFINPLQFGANEDLDKYPKTLTEDQDKLSGAGCDLLFAPSVEEMYPGGKSIKTTVSVADISAQHCGASRPGHFAGVATVVAKLFAMVQPDAAFFGKKDWQQLAVIRQMAADLSFPIDIIGIATARNSDGLALSSRNGYLSPEQLQLAPELYATLQGLQARIEQGERNYSQLQQAAATQLNSLGFNTDYVHICQQQSLLPATADDQALVILAAAQLGPARLIDNLDFRLGA